MTDYDKTDYQQTNHSNCINIHIATRAGLGWEGQVLLIFHLPSLKSWRKLAGHSWW